VEGRAATGWSPGVLDIVRVKQEHDGFTIGRISHISNVEQQLAEVHAQVSLGMPEQHLHQLKPVHDRSSRNWRRLCSRIASSCRIAYTIGFSFGN
jgi:hypothetical protein